MIKNKVIRFNPAEDEELLSEIHKIIDQRASYGYRRVKVLLNNLLKIRGKNKVNHKHIYRIMKQNNLLLPAYGKKPSRSHEGKIITLNSNMR